jgi:hypothetical protein
LIIKAAITPGTHPAMVNAITIKIEPQPLSKTDNGGKKIHASALKKLIGNKFVQMSEKNMNTRFSIFEWSI